MHRFFASLRMTTHKHDDNTHENRLGCLGCLRRFTEVCQPILCLFQTLRRSLGGGNQLLYIGKDCRTLHSFADFFQEWFNLSIENEHLAREAWLQEQLSIQSAAQYKRRAHLPVAAHLPQPIIFLGSQCTCDFYDVVRGSRPKSEPPVTRFSTLGLTAQVIEFNDQFSIGSCWGSGHFCLL